MKLEELFLKKEEIPVSNTGYFQVPIHPKLLSNEIRINEYTARNIFPDVVEEWYDDLNCYVESEKSINGNWIKEFFLKQEPVLKKQYGRQRIANLNWRDDFSTLDNGFARVFSISRNSGGTLYFNKNDSSCESLILNSFVKISDEKAKEFEFEKSGGNTIGLVYGSHNIDNYPGALFLRNWAIKYMNEVFKEVF